MKSHTTMGLSHQAFLIPIYCPIRSLLATLCLNSIPSWRNKGKGSSLGKQYFIDIPWHPLAWSPFPQEPWWSQLFRRAPARKPMSCQTGWKGQRLNSKGEIRKLGSGLSESDTRDCFREPCHPQCHEALEWFLMFTVYKKFTFHMKKKLSLYVFVTLQNLSELFL